MLAQPRDVKMHTSCSGFHLYQEVTPRPCGLHGMHGVGGRCLSLMVGAAPSANLSETSDDLGSQGHVANVIHYKGPAH